MGLAELILDVLAAWTGAGNNYVQRKVESKKTGKKMDNFKTAETVFRATNASVSAASRYVMDKNKKQDK
ncbi:MAG: hypothetical protein IK025_10500 [Bacteroidales bacterium]|nr:hypothetical protein [Bacteroidales bacterium]